MKKVSLSKKEIKGLNKEIKEYFGYDNFFDVKDPLKIVDDEYIVLDDKLVFFYKEGKLVPSLKLLLIKNILKEIIVDMGAVPFVVKGSDIMRPGIVGVDPYIEQGDVIVIKDEDNMKPLAIGEALFSKEEMEKMQVGKAIINLHYVGDKIWNMRF